MRTVRTIKGTIRAGAKRWLWGILLVAGVLCAAQDAGALVYIDISRPPRKLPLALQPFTGSHGREISGIVLDDLTFSGLFEPLDPEAFLEGPGEAFRRSDWTGIGAELVVKGSVTAGEQLQVAVAVYDVFEGRAVMQKQYRADASLLRPLAHEISNDIYETVTGHQGVFRTKVAYVVHGKSSRRLFVADWDGKRKRDLKVGGRLLLAPHWSPAGDALVYSAERGRKWGIHLLDLRRMKESLVFSSGGTDIAGDFFPGGEEFALSSSKEGTPDIYTYDLRNSRLKRITSLKGIAVSPSVSPDGGSIAFVSDRGGSPQIYTTDKIGYNMTRITYSGPYNTSPTWSPKGDRLAFSGRHEGRNQIFTVKPNGTGLMMLTEAGNNENPSFSPDGRFIAFTSDRDGAKGIWIMRANGEGQKKITPWGREAFGPGWSPK
ncbi:MAG: Tol-Pal system beta propeller repeat protein TolB [Nitrospirota bacterium]